MRPASSALGAQATIQGGQWLKKAGDANLYRFPNSQAASAQAVGPVPYSPSADRCAEIKAQSPGVLCSPNFIRKASALPNDPGFSYLHGLENGSGYDIDAPEAWDTTTGSDAPVVAVIDTGIDYLHEDLAQNMWRNSGEIPDNGIDDDGNGVVDDVHGYNAVANSGDPMDDHYHGTHCAGTIGAAGNNGIGITGVNWRVKLMGVKFLNSQGSGGSVEELRSYDYVLRMKQRGVKIVAISASYGGGGANEIALEYIRRLGDAGVLFIAAAGNESENNDDNPSYPANYPVENVISVAAVDQSGDLASFSNYGQHTVDIAAPGVSIISTVPGSQYGELSGTSMATPHVSGVAALLASAGPNRSWLDIRNAILQGSVQLSSLSGLVANARALNARSALDAFLASQPSPQPTPRPTPEPQPTPAPETSDLDIRVGGGVNGLRKNVRVGEQIGVTIFPQAGGQAEGILALFVGRTQCPQLFRVVTNRNGLRLSSRLSGVTRSTQVTYVVANTEKQITGADAVVLNPRRGARGRTRVSVVCNSFAQTLRVR
jgi:subtilisin family serine protease